MSTPVIESIAENIKTAINEITTEAGFNQTLSAVRPKRTDFLAESWDDLTVLIEQGQCEELSGGMNYKMWRQHFVLMAIVIDSDIATDSIDTRENQVRADIEKKFAVDINRGNLAINTDFHGAIPFKAEDGANSGIAIEISVDYRTLETDPYTGV